MAITLPVPVTAKDWQRGAADAAITLVEYADFQCEDSQAAYPILRQLWEDNGDRLRFVYRHLPLTDVHIHALDAAKAAEAAGLLDHFWEMHDALYENASPLTRENLEAQAVDLGMDVKAYEEAFADPRAYAAVREDVDGLRKTGIGSTPTLFINGLHYEGPFTAEALGEAVARAGGGQAR